MPMGQWWELKQIDENTWDRPIYLYCMPCQKWETGSYTLVRIIDGEGNELPAFDEMVGEVRAKKKVKGINPKPEQQILNGVDWKGTLFFGNAGRPDINGEPSDEYRAMQP